MFSIMLSENSSMFCGTYAIQLRKDSISMSLLSTPFMYILPACISKNLRSNLATVVFPLPDCPTSATFFPFGIVKLNSFRMGCLYQ